MDREHTLHQDTWLVDINNYRELGECVATFNHRIGNDSFVGTAEMTVEDGIRKVEITLICDENERYRCERGDLICTEKTPCGKDQCPTCGGVPF